MNAHVARLEELRSSGQDFVTDEFAAEGTYEWHLNRARIDLDAHRGGQPGGRRQVEFQSASDLISRPPKPMLWTVQGVIPEQSLYGIIAEPKSSKTWAEIVFAIAVANGVPAFGEFLVSDPGDAALFLAEDSEQSIRTRLAATARGMGLDPIEATKRIHVQCRGTLDLSRDRDVCEVIAGVRALERKVKIVCLDPLRDVHTAEENSSSEMAPVMANLRALRSILGCSIVFVHHAAKSGGDKSGRRPGQMARGSSVIHASVDGGFYMSLGKGASECTWPNTVLVETKTGRSAGLFGLTLDVEDDENGEARVARWTFSREAAAKGSPVSVDSLVQQVVEVLANSTAPNGLTRAELRARLSVSKASSGEAIDAAANRGLIAKEGAKKGFQVTSEGRSWLAGLLSEDPQ